MPQIFISYSRVDTTFVERFINRLQRAFPHIKIWHDQSPHGLIGGDNWWDAILQGIADSDIFIYILSNESVQSLYCQAEFTEARRLQKRIITIQARDKTELTDDLDDIQFIDMKNGPDDPDGLVGLTAAVNKQMTLAKRQRPLWKPATPKPRKEAPPVRTAESPDIETPPLTPPTAEQEALKIGKTGLRWQIGLGVATLAVTLLATVLGLLPWLIERNESANATQTAQAVAQQNMPTLTDALSTETETVDTTETDEPTDPITPSATPTEAASLDVFYIVQTLDAQASAAARATHIMATTQAVIDATATATLWTHTPTPTFTPTPNITASIEAFQTQRVLDWTATAVRGATETVEAYTDTPTFTPTYTPTATPTLTDLERASTPVARNSDWTPIEGDFDGVTMVLVPAGSFMMGSEAGDDDEKPAHRQDINQPFWIDKYEVTNGQFAQFEGVAGRESRWTDENRPREQITWLEARDFCQKRGARLPTEVEWEYVARGPDGLIYPWGNNFVAENAVYRDNSSSQTADVGSRLGGASWVGALDMSGNVWEWGSSLYLPYPYVFEEAETTNRTRVLRGGSWGSADFDLRASDRDRYGPVVQYDVMGFRCARSP